ncbi:CHAT domain-containing protein [Microlunatus ginsengisoli]|uniref:CHAT domain-containing protein n=1 Tax=Microlunatus ginsengisoli TaxID=363863 RepID=A0ABP6ZJR4_9ACTN
MQPIPALRARADAALAMVDRDPGSGITAARQVVRAAARAGEPAAASIGERAWGHALLHVGELDDAARHLRRAALLGERAGAPELVGEARSKLAFALVQQGRPRAALREVEAAIPQLDGVPAARARAQRAIVLHIMGRLDDSLDDYERALRVLRRHDDKLGVQRMLINRALVHSDRYAFGAAERDLLEAATLATELDRRLTIGLIANNLGALDTLRGDVPAALRQLDRAEAIIGAHGAQLGTLHQDRAQLLLTVGLVAEAEEAATRAIVAYNREGRGLKVPEVQLLLAQAALLTGRVRLSADHAGAAFDRFRAQSRPEWRELARLGRLRAQLRAGERPRVADRTLDAMVGSLRAAGWPGAALDASLVAVEIGTRRRGAESAPVRARLDEAAAAATSRGPALLRARGWYARALAAEAAGDDTGSLRAARAGLRILDEHAATMGASDLRVHAAVHRSDLVDLGLRVSFRSRRAGRLLEWSERARASRLLTAPVQPPDDPELAAALAELRSVTKTAADPGPGQPELVARQAQLERRIRDRARYLAGGSAAVRGPVRLAELADVLGRRALVGFVQWQGQIHALTVVDRRLSIRPVAPTRIVADLVDRLEFAFRRHARPAHGPVRDASAQLLASAAGQLDTTLLGGPPETAGRPLVIVPTGPLHSVPWALLPSCVGRAVTVSPSATLWRAAAARFVPVDRTSAPAVVVVAGPRLSAAHQEALAVARLHADRCSALVGQASTVEAVRSALGGAELVHLATHGRLSAENPLFSHLELVDGPLMIFDVERLPRVPDTLVLASCDSGRSAVRAGDELIGLAVAFLERGTTQLIASVLSVPDAPTVPVMIALHERLAAGLPAAEALAAAQAALLPLGGEQLAAAAGFVCFGV